MKYQIYQITNKTNGKIYIGKHQCSCKECQYFGSGKLLKRAIKKHGIENFTKIILFEYDTEQEMISKEKELVTEEFCKDNTNYNLCEGGKGGFGYINSSSEFIEQRILKNKKAREKTNSILKKKYGDSFQSELGKIGSKKTLLNDPFHMKKMRKSLDRKYPEGTFKNKKHSDNTKNKMSEKQKKIDRTGSKNPSFGKIWITNDIEYKMIKKEDNIPEGWRKGKIQPQNKIKGYGSA